MKNIVVILFLLISLFSQAQTDDPYYLDIEDYPKLKLPSNLRIDSIQGKIISHIKLDNNANILGLEWVVVLLKDSKENYFIQYRKAVNKSYSLKDYPLPIRPYVKLVKRKISKLKFKKRNNVSKPKGEWYYTIPYIVY